MPLTLHVQALGAQLFSEFEARGNGVQWDNISEAVSVDDSFTFATVIGMLVLDTFMYLVLAWCACVLCMHAVAMLTWCRYIENVFPGDYGIPKPFYFFVMVRPLL